MIRYGIEKNLVTLATLFDFRRAFDSIDHEALLRECKNMNFSPDAIKWVHSYISGRTQAVVCQDEQSDFLPVTSGVPQGSSPGPIFFSILINSLPQCLKYCKFSYILFADDLQLFIQCPANLISSAVAHMTEDASYVSRWANDHGLQLNPSKTKSIIFGSTPNLVFLANQQLPSVVVDNHPVEYVSQIKNLGVIMTTDLTWNAHIRSVSSKVHNALFKLRQRAWLIPRDVKKLLVQALVISHLDYACLVYDSMPGYLKLKVERLMNAGIRYIYNLRRDSHISPYRSELEWLKACDRRKYFQGCFTFRILNTQRPLYFYQALSEQFIPLRRSERLQSLSINIPTASSESYKNSFLITALEFWSMLPSDVLNAPSFYIFSSNLMKHLRASQ